MERRLAAILAADLVGYSRLMGEDEEGTLARLDSLRTEVLDPVISRYRGRVVKLMGDGILVEFHSVADAIACARQWQEAVERLARRMSQDQALRYRIGINLGDVIIKEGDIFGAGVNLAARLETLADPGGICVSQPVIDQLERRLRDRFEDLGEHPMKNLARPVRVWRWNPDGSAAAAREAMRAGVVPLSEKPAIAVLPFRNMSPDPDQEYFADGITEEILTLLARDRWLVVIARSSTFPYKNKPVDVRSISKDLGANYVLEGGVRKAGANVRISAQLSRGADAHHIWSDRYDSDLEHIFDVQDKIAGAIAAAISPALGVAQREIARRKPPQSLDAWDYCWQGLWHFYKFTTEELREAERSSPHDPELWHFYDMYDMRSTAHLSLRELDQAEFYTRKALRQPNCTFWPYAMLASILGLEGRSEEAKDAAAALLGKRPNYTCRQARQDLYFCGNLTFTDYFIEGLRKSQVPD